MDKKVIVAMSGGIDSSVAAALLKKAGFDVIGVFMKFWSENGSNTKKENKCCNQDAEARARKVASKLGILFYVLNVEKEFKKAVVDYFLKEYKAGRTPNPCVVCNKEIKFKFLMDKATELRADFIATGHYAKIKKEKGIFKLLKAKDKNKDQSYFLWKLGQKELGRILFPVGGYTRDEVEKLAKKFNLPAVTSVKKSQEVCFVLTDLESFLKKYIAMKPGKIINNKGKILGTHQGLAFYTMGQRKGIKLAGGPYFVLDKNFKKNALIVTNNEKDLYKKEVKVEEINWIFGKKPELPLKIKAKIRYRHKSASATICKILRQERIRLGRKNTGYQIIFGGSQKAVTSGQSIVFYKGDEVLAGGTIS